ncbi:MAG: adenylosuccinate lyase [Candidatus Micrarchaeia archaeon]|jgi:adenylosuccinate lyase
MHSGHNFESYLSPFTWRYASPDMRSLFSEKQNRLLWRKCWLSLAKAQNKAGIVSDSEAKDIAAHAEGVDIEKSLGIEKEIGHDLMAELKVFSSQCKVGGGKLHLGATSMDIEDNAEAVRTKKALAIVSKKLKSLLSEFSEKISKYENTPCMAYTHLQPAEPTTLGYRFANYAQDLLIDLEQLQALEKNFKGKGLKGAVGNAASYKALLEGTKATPQALEQDFLNELGLQAFDATTQTSPRKQDYLLLSAIAALAQSLHRFAQDVRIMQSPAFGEVAEPFGEKQVGSSAMPFKRNPVKCEKICSLSRFISTLPKAAWDNAALSMLERTLDDSANRRLIIPEAFLAIDECLSVARAVVAGLQVNEKQIERNMETYAPFSATEALLLALAKKGASRQDAHEIIRENAMIAWSAVREGKPNPLAALLSGDSRITRLVPRAEVEKLVSVRTAKAHTGIAAQKCESILAQIRRAA